MSNQPLSLKVRAALNLTSKLSFEEVFSMVGNPQDQLAQLLSEVANDELFWRSIAIRYFSHDILYRRMDVLPDEWKDYAVGLYSKCESCYTLITPIGSSQGDLILLYHGSVKGDSRRDIMLQYELPENHQRNFHFTLHGSQPKIGSLGYGISSFFARKDYRCSVYVCREKSQIPEMFDRMINSLAVRILDYYDRHRDIFVDGCQILDVTFNEEPTIGVLKAIILKWLSLPHLEWNLDRTKFSSYEKSTTRSRRLRGYSPDMVTLFELDITIVELIFP